MAQSSEVETQRMSLIGVGPKSRSLKFLTTKNNIADMYLQKQLEMLERESTTNLATLEQSKADTRLFLTNIQKLEQDTETYKQLLKRPDDYVERSPRALMKRKKARKIRLAQTAPASLQKKEEETHAERRRQLPNSGPETQAEKDHLLKMNRQKSMFIQLPGHGRQSQASVEPLQQQTKVESKPVQNVYVSKKQKQENRAKALPEPSAKSLLDVMIGLNAFSHVPSRRLSSRADSFDGNMRAESRDSMMSRDSIYGSDELMANRFMLQWKNKIANRKNSIFVKLEAKTDDDPLQRSMSNSMMEVLEEEEDDDFQKRKSTKYSIRPSMRSVRQLPAITDEGERMEVFMAWINDEKDKQKKFDATFVNPHDKIAVRRNSFKHWLRHRKGDPEENKVEVHNKVPVIREESESPADLGCLMKTMMTIKKQFRDPLDSRVKRFNEQIDDVKKRDEAFRMRRIRREEMRRKQGYWFGPDYDADFSDDDDYYY